jgi:hypothetical protein
MVSGNTSGGIWDIFFSPLPETSKIWILIFVGLGALIGECVKFIFSQILPEWRRKKTTRNAIQKYSYPPQQTAYRLIFLMMKHILTVTLKKQESDIDEGHRLFLLYNLGCFFGWCRALDNESYLETSIGIRAQFTDPQVDQMASFFKKEMEEKGFRLFKAESRYTPRKLYETLFHVFRRRSQENISNHIELIFQSLSQSHFFYNSGEYIPSEEEVNSSSLGRTVMTSIGDIMIKEQTNKMLNYRILNFAEFREVWIRW